MKEQYGLQDIEIITTDDTDSHTEAITQRMINIHGKGIEAIHAKTQLGFFEQNGKVIDSYGLDDAATELPKTVADMQLELVRIANQKRNRLARQRLNQLEEISRNTTHKNYVCLDDYIGYMDIGFSSFKEAENYSQLYNEIHTYRNRASQEKNLYIFGVEYNTTLIECHTYNQITGRFQKDLMMSRKLIAKNVEIHEKNRISLILYESNNQNRGIER